MTPKLGVVEGFFGPAWPKRNRFEYAQFLGENRFGFYLYAPKADAFLRKKWKKDWPKNYVDFLHDLAREFRRQGVKFGVALSPYGLDKKTLPQDLNLLKKKIGILNKIGIDLLGIFFDDMASKEFSAGEPPLNPVAERGPASTRGEPTGLVLGSGGKGGSPALNSYMASIHLRTVETARSHCSARLIFCPTYYSYDPVLEKIFGPMPQRYLEELGQNTPPEVEIAWTGPRVISPEISKSHLAGISSIFKRKPFIFDNFFANDGPRNCKFLKIKAPTGRTTDALKMTSGWAFNPMNQPELSKILLLAAKNTMLNNQPPERALDAALKKSCSQKLARLISQNQKLFTEVGLEKINPSSKRALLDGLKNTPEQAAKEIAGWLNGKYIVGKECLTD